MGCFSNKYKTLSNPARHVWNVTGERNMISRSGWGTFPAFTLWWGPCLRKHCSLWCPAPSPQNQNENREMKQNCRTIVPSSRNSAVTGSQPVMSSPLKRHLKPKITSAGRARTDERWYEAPASFSNNSRNITNYSLPHFSLKLLYCLFVFCFNFGYYWLSLLIAICF